MNLLIVKIPPPKGDGIFFNLKQKQYPSFQTEKL